MTKDFLFYILVFFFLQIAYQDDAKKYQDQGPIQLVPGITNFGYSPDQRNLVALTSTGANNSFVFYEGLRLNFYKNITIIDDDPFNVKPSAFAFSSDGSWLVVGTSYGSVYGFQINDAKIAQKFKLKKDIGTASIEDGIKSISFSAKGLIAVAAKDRLVILEVPTDDDKATLFKVKANHTFVGILSSVAWKLNSQAITIVGGFDAVPYFHLLDIETGMNSSIETQTIKTTSIGVFPDTDYILQGRFDENIEVYQWDGTKNYIRVDTINGTRNASKISISANGLYFGAEINSLGKVRAWKSGLRLNAENNLQNQPLKQILIDDYMTQDGKKLALSSDGNRILVIDDSGKATKWSLCDKNFYYNNKTYDCQPCPNTCGQCFNPQNCNTCPDKTKYVDNNNACQPCSTVIDGCKICQDSTTCNECNQTQHFKPTPDANQCKCDSGFYPVNKSCSSCQSILYCLECSAADKCETCIDTDHIDKKPVNDSCFCVTKWYFDDKKICQDCTKTQNGCLTCNSTTYCTTCDQPNNWISDGKGKCICDVGFWQDGPACRPCSNKTTYCTTCEQNGTCTKCQPTRVINPEKTQCICENHTYEDPTNQTCMPCNTDQCLHCEVKPPHTCTQCDNITEHRRPVPEQGKCICEPGYTEDDNLKCTRCFIAGCEDCNKLDTCSLCFEARNFIAKPDNGKCNCKSGYLPDTDGQYCFTCDDKIPGCISCQNLTECQTCNGEAHFIPEPNSTHQCDCQPQYFLKGSFCKLCFDEYTGCELCDSSKCLTCKANYHLTDDKKKCLSCEQAIPGCAQCTDIHKCTNCTTDKNWELDIDTNICACKPSFYQNGTQCNYCAIQFPYCSTCNIQACDTCQETFTYSKELKTCFCPDDKEIKDGKCEDKSGLSALAIIAIIVGILAVAGGAVAIIKCFKKRQSPLEDGEYEALEAEKNQ